MANKKHVDKMAAKQAKQKKILIVGAVALLGVGGLQGPKMFKKGGSKEPISATADGASTATPGTTPTGPTTVRAPEVETIAAVGAVPTASVAGLEILGAGKPAIAPSQMRRFTLFQQKDPFVPQVKEKPAESTTSEASPAHAEPTAKSQKADAGGAPSGAPSGTPSLKPGASAVADEPGATPVAKPIEPAPGFATLVVNGITTQLEVEQQFPVDEPLFVLVALTKKTAKIGIAGGSLRGGKTVTVPLGKRVTLVNTSTGARYVIKLVFTGTEPEVIEGFSSDASPAPTAQPEAAPPEPKVTEDATTP